MHWFIEFIHSHGDKSAIVDMNGDFTYGQLTNQVQNYLHNIDKRIKPGNVVVILADYSFYSISLFLMLLERQCIIVPVVSQVEDEIAEKLEESHCDWIIKITADSISFQRREATEKHPMIQKVINKHHAGLILFSSGSTGKPKAMLHDLDVLVESYRGRKAKKLTMLVFLMFDHIGGLNTLLNSLAMGAKIVIPSTREAEKVGKLIEQNKVSVLPASPTFLNLILMANVPENYDLSSVKMITYGTEPMPESLLKRLKEAFPKVRFLQTFGTSETGIVQTSSRTSTSLEIKIDDPNQEYKIVNNELWLRSKTQVLGYLNASMDSFTEDGWFKTGDIVEVTEDGYLRIIGRNKEVINVGGEKVLPTEVESVLMELNEVIDAMVYGEQNAITGQSVVANIVVKEEENEPKKLKKLVRKYCKKRLDKYKVPTKIHIKDSMNYSLRFKKIRL